LAKWYRQFRWWWIYDERDCTIVDMHFERDEVDVNESYIARVENGQLVTAR